ncbi:MAG: hypothetical protein HYS57_00695, partial [Parcubacteria group bacterium]|nr:hypothetical protein [Parcubacteria group bacterium]
INAVEGTIVFPDPLLELKEVRDAQSIVSFWVEKPNTPLTETHTNTNKHEVIFSGIVPGGYRGERGLLFSLVFFARKEAQALMELQDVKALLNDGRGTETNTKSGNLLVSIRADANIPSWIAPKDRERPESFVPEIARDPTVFRGKWFLVFSTQDKGSGSVHYELKETRQTRLGVFSKWTIVESPYVLRDQALRSYIFVKAVDRAGNARTVKVVPQNPLRWYENYEIWFIIMLGLVTVYEIKKVLPRISLRK